MRHRYVLWSLFGAFICTVGAPDSGLAEPVSPAEPGASPSGTRPGTQAGPGIASPPLGLPNALLELEALGHTPLEEPFLPGAPPILLRNATVWTADGQRFAPGHLLMQEGRIAAVGPGPGTAPAGATLLDLDGAFVTPGLIDTHSHLGVYPSPGTAAHDDGNEATSPVTGGVWAEHSIWPGDPGLQRAVAGGVTTAAILPGSANLIGGRGVVVHLLPQRGSRAMRFPGSPEIVKLACGENPKRVYGGQKRTPSTRMANLAELRTAFIKAQQYVEDWRRYEQALARMAGQSSPTDAPTRPWRRKSKSTPPAGEKEPPRPPARDLSLETLAGVLHHRILVQWHCYTSDDMLAALQVADEFGFRVRSFHHALEAYKIRDILARKDVAVSTWSDWYGFKVEAWDGIPESIALIEADGGRPAVHSDSGVGIQLLNQDAAKALAAGRAADLPLDEDDALRWITANPAWILGIDQQVGTLSVGKLADVVVWTHHPLSIRARAARVFVQGAQVYSLAEETPPWSDFELGLRDRRVLPSAQEGAP